PRRIPLPSLIFRFAAPRVHRALHSFPTRRSSDLREKNWADRAYLNQIGCLVSIVIVTLGIPLDYIVYPDHFAQFTALRLFEVGRSEEHTSELQSRENLVCRLLLEKKDGNTTNKCR